MTAVKPLRRDEPEMSRKERLARLGVGAGLLGTAYGLHKYGDRIDAAIHSRMDAAIRAKHGGRPDEIGGTTKEKLERLASRAKGTPEGDAAARKLTRIREKQGLTFTKKAKHVITKVVSRISPKKAVFGGHLMSAREQLEVIALGIPKNLTIKRSSAVAQGDLDLLRQRNLERLHPKKKIHKRVTKESLIKARIMGGSQTETHLSARDRLIELKAVDLGYTYGDMEYGPCAGAASSQKKHFPSLYIHDRANDIDLPLSGKAVITYKLRSKTTRQNEEGNKRHSADIEIQTIDPIKEEEKAPKEGDKAKVRTLSARDELNGIIRFELTRSVAPGIEAALQALARHRKKIGAGKVVARKIHRPIGTLIGRKTGVPAKGWYPERSSESFTARLQNVIELADPRPRNSLGMFKDSDDQSIDPNSIDTVYKKARTIGESSVGQNLTGGAIAGVGAAASGGALKALFSKLRKAHV